MLDVITDFWKPVKKVAAENQNKLRLDELAAGSTIGFGFVPQTLLSGRRLEVSAINTYQFGEEALTSFVLTQENDPAVSLIIGAGSPEAGVEPYLGISRRISFSDRMKMFDSRELDEVMEKPDTATLRCQDSVPSFKNWVVPSYRRTIQGMKGRIIRGDYRGQPVPESTPDAQNFQYYLLVSESEEHAIEIEKYDDGRIEMYATISRRIADIGEVKHSSKEAAANGAKPMLPVLEKATPAEQAKAPEAAAPKVESKPEAPVAPVVASAPATPEKQPETTSKPSQEAAQVSPKAEANGTATTINANVEKPNMLNTIPENKTEKTEAGKPSNVLNLSAEDKNWREVMRVDEKLEKATEETLECNLQVAVKIFDEAMRNEMKIADVVRRIVELPLASQQTVQIPLALSDGDYLRLSRRYGIDATDKEAIKRRVIQDLAEFTGKV